ncbi:MAG: cadherin-like beta sandwich domain-containing protein, partial [Clostridia bacterium]|nr:cadherin-like beta sandwich domain-containing protein [Clostridia bacterium]
KTALSFTDGPKSASVDINFKAITVGKGTFSVTDSTYTDLSYQQEFKISDSGASVQVKDKSAAKSSNANLTYIRVSAGTLSPNFSANTTSYNITVPYSVTEVLAYTETVDKNATVAIEGSKTMKVGANKRVIKVTAQDGTVKSYTLNITRLASDDASSSSSTSSDQTTSEPTEPTAPTQSEKVIVDGVEKYIAENFSQELVYEGFALTTYKYNDKEYPAITDGGTTLLYLVDEEGKNGAFYRIDKQNNITSFSFLTVGGNMYQLLIPDEEDMKDDYITTTVTIDGKEYDAFKRVSDKDSEFVFFWAKFSDNTGLYRFDTVEKTMQRAEGLMVPVSDNEPVSNNQEDGNWLQNLKNMNANGKIVAITIVAILLLLIAAIIVMIIKLASPSKDDYDEYIEEDEKEDYFKFDSIKTTDRDDK